MAINFIGTDINGVDATAINDTWILTELNTLSNFGDAFDFLAFSSVKLIVDGLIVSESDGIDSDFNSSDNKITIGTTGSVIGASDGIEMSGDFHEVINNGEITGFGDNGVEMVGSTHTLARQQRRNHRPRCRRAFGWHWG